MFNTQLPVTYKLLANPLTWRHQHNTPNDLPTFSSSPEDIRWCVTCNTPTDLQTVSSSHALKTSDDVYQTTLPMTCKLLADLLSWRHQHNTPNDLQTVSWSPVLKTSTQHSQWLVDRYLISCPEDINTTLPMTCRLLADLLPWRPSAQHSQWLVDC